MTPIINVYFNKHSISWELVNSSLLYISDSVLKAMWRHRTLTSILKQFPKKINRAPCRICYTKKTTFPKGTTIDTTNLQLEGKFHMYLSSYNVPSILGFTSMLNVVCAKTRTLWVFPTASKIACVRIIHFILTTFNHEQHPCKHVIVDYYG